MGYIETDKLIKVLDRIVPDRRRAIISLLRKDEVFRVELVQRVILPGLADIGKKNVTLTQREKNIGWFLLMHFSTRDIADHFNISMSSVYTSVYAMKRKLKIHTMDELTAWLLTNKDQLEPSSEVTDGQATIQRSADRPSTCI